MSTSSDVANKMIQNLEIRLEKDERVPFLRTCPKCNAPLRSNDMIISVAISSFSPKSIDNIHYYCTDHTPDADQLTNDLLNSYSIVANIKIIEPSPDCNASERTIKIKNYDYSQPDKL